MELVLQIKAFTTSILFSSSELRYFLLSPQSLENVDINVGTYYNSTDVAKKYPICSIDNVDPYLPEIQYFHLGYAFS